MDYIKTGEEIYEEILEYADTNGKHALSDKHFVRVDWLKEQLEKKKAEMFSPLEQGQTLNTCNWVIDLITDICLDCKNNLGEHCEEAELSDTKSLEHGNCLVCKYFTPKEVVS